LREPWAHRHPTYHQGIADHELMVLSYPQPINERSTSALRRICVWWSWSRLARW
jgi:hypothetical protein